MRHFLKIGISFVMALTISGCAGNLLHGLGFESDTPSFWAAYDYVKAENDALAAAKKITWAQASTRVRDADKYMAENKSGYDTSWKFDADDEEYHSYVIAISEQLDRKLISFASFDAARIAKRNEIDTRRQSINLQHQAIRNVSQPTQRGGIMCIRNKEISAGMGTHCVYDCAGSEVIQTIGPAQICPIQIRR